MQSLLLVSASLFSSSPILIKWAWPSFSSSLLAAAGLATAIYFSANLRNASLPSLFTYQELESGETLEEDRAQCRGISNKK